MMSSMATTTLMSFAEFERLAEGPDHVELLKGELVRMPPAQRSHMQICRKLFRLLDACAERFRTENPDARLGTVYFEMGYIFPGEKPSWLQPDVSLTHPDQAGDRYYVGAPLIAFEVVSESDNAFQLDEKVSEYLQNGAREVWLIYPKKRHAWVYAPAGTARQETRAIQTDLLPGVEIPLDEIL